MNKRLASIGFWTVTGFFVFAAMQMTAPESQSAVEKKQYTDVLEAARDHKLNQLKVVGNEITGTMQTKDGHTVQFKSTLTEFDRDAITEIRKTGTAIDVEDPPGTPWYQTALEYIALPILFVGFLLIGSRLMNGKGGGGPMGVGKSPGKLVDTTKTKKITFADVAGVDEARAEVAETIDFLRDPRKYTALGGRMPKGTLLVGPPGNGKTLLAKAVAGEAGVPFFSISGSDFVEMFVGVGAARVRDLFEQGRKHAPCIIFIDEIDAIGKIRNNGFGAGGASEHENTLNQLLVEMDGFNNSEGVILMAATNRPEILDPALVRAGRFDRHVTVGLPHIQGREDILRVHTRKVPLAKDTNLRTIARGTTGFSGADLERLVNEAALGGARAGKTTIDIHDFEVAKDKIIFGTENKSINMSKEEKESTAWHEAGHTLVGLMVAGNDPVHKVTIVPHGQALGITALLPKEDRHSIRKSQLKAQLAMMYGGRVAEEIIYGEEEVSTGAQNDVERATEVAERMVKKWGFSELGAVNFENKQQNAFYGAANNDSSPKLKEDIEKARDNILKNAEKVARKVLDDHRDKLTAIAGALIEYETIDETDLDDIMNGRPLRTPNLPPPTGCPAPMPP